MEGPAMEVLTDGLEIGVPKVLNNEIAKGRDPSRRNGYCHNQQEPKIGLWVQKCLLNMIPSPLSRDNTHLVCSEPFDGDDFLALAEKLAFHGRVGHDQEDDDGVDHGQEAAEEENDLGCSSEGEKQVMGGTQLGIPGI